MWCLRNVLRGLFSWRRLLVVPVLAVAAGMLAPGALADSGGPSVMVCLAKPQARSDGSVGSFFDVSVATWTAGVGNPDSIYYQSRPAIYVEGYGTMCRLSDLVSYGADPTAFVDAGYKVDEAGVRAPTGVSPGDWGAAYEYYGRAGGWAAPFGFDVSYPQCDGALPTTALFGIVGVNKGIVFSPNPCLTQELQWAWTPDAGNLILYANTADPGPTLSSHWPDGQSAPESCNPDKSSDLSARDTPQCAYDYGYNAAADGYQNAVNAYAAIGQTPTTQQWWLDVETANSWEANTANNIANLQGALDYLLRVAKVSSVGVYTSAPDWQTITGSDTTDFASQPYWHPGTGSQASARSACDTTGPTGGTTIISQGSYGRFDADLRC